MNVSIKEISKRAGVSIATVSRVINGNGYVSKATEALVRSTIKECGYIPNMAARGLRTQHYPIIGILVPDITNEFFGSLVKSVQLNLLERGYSALIYNTNESKEITHKCFKLLQMHNASGLILISEYIADEFVKRNMPVVYIDRHPRNRIPEGEVLIESDNRQGARLAMQELMLRGCRRIAIMIDSRNFSIHTIRLDSCIEELKRVGCEADARLILRPKDLSFSESRRVTSELIESGIPFDGIFCMSDMMALGAVTALSAHGIKVPQAVKVIGFDDVSVGKLSAMPVTTIKQQIETMSALAVEMLIKMLNREPIEKYHIVLPVELIRRTTT